jgi:hypothetical protein
VQEKDALLHQRNLDVQEINHQLQEKKQKLENMLESLSWRLTRPIRWFETKLKKMNK